MAEEEPVHLLSADNYELRLDERSGQILVAGGTDGPPHDHTKKQNPRKVVYILFDCRVENRKSSLLLQLQKLLAKLRTLLAQHRKKERNPHSWSLLREVTARSIKNLSPSTKHTLLPLRHLRPMFRVHEIFKQRWETNSLLIVDIYVISWFVPTLSLIHI